MSSVKTKNFWADRRRQKKLKAIVDSVIKKRLYSGKGKKNGN